MPSEMGELKDIPLTELFLDNSFNSRGPIVPIDVAEFARSLEKEKLQNPITVQPWQDPTNPNIKYRIISGHRRTLAFKILKRTSIPAIVRHDLLTDLDARKANLVENLHRKQLNIKQEAHALKPFFDASWTEMEIASHLEQSRGWVKIRQMLLTLPEDIQDVAAAGLINQEHIRQMYGKPKEQQYEFVREVKEAKARGEKITIEKPEKKINPHDKVVRTRRQMFEMIERLIGIAGAGLHTRALAWAAGEISEYELMKDFKKYCDMIDVPYEIPNEMVMARLVT